MPDLHRKTKDDIKKILSTKWKYNQHKSAQATSQLLGLRDKVKKGNIVLAYLGNNTISLVGEVLKEYQFNDRNSVGDPNGEIGYPHQIAVDWWPHPRNFHRSYLPGALPSWVSRVGTIGFRHYNDLTKFKHGLQRIPSQDIVTKALQIDSENEIKEYMERHLQEVESGLVLIRREFVTSEGTMDFLAKDKHGTPTVVEVKRKADDSASTQTRRYMRAYGKQKGEGVRGIIVAEEFTHRCIEDVKELRDRNYDIKLYTARKRFGFESRY